MYTYKNLFVICIYLLSLKYNQILAANEKQCFSCDGINCQRTTLNKTEICNDPLDMCVTIFKDFTVETKGCLLRMPEEHRLKCNDPKNYECDKCEGDLCNKYGRKDFLCVECETKTNANCNDHPEKIPPTRCLSPTAINSYCFTEKGPDGKVTKRGCAIDTKYQKSCYNGNSGTDCNLCLPSDTDVCNGPRQLSCSTDEYNTQQNPTPTRAGSDDIPKLTALTGTLAGISLIISKNMYFL